MWKLLIIFVMVDYQKIKRLFEVKFLDNADDFLFKIDPKAANKIIYNIDKASYSQDPSLLKKVSGEIWEFRTRFSKIQYRMLAFWDKREIKNTLIICSHGFIKKTNKIREKEIIRAEKVRREYFK